MERIEVNGFTFLLAEVHRRAPKSWDRSRKRLRFDGFLLALPGSGQSWLEATRESALAFAEKLTADPFADNYQSIKARNAEAIQLSNEELISRMDLRI